MMPPELNEDVTTEILLRIPPDEPAHLIRASVVSKLWLRVVSDPAFLSRYRAFHRGAPLLGFFYSPDSPWSYLSFVPTTVASSPPQPWHSNRRWVRRVSDCRHGRVLLGIGSRSFVVWDPLSNHWEQLKAPRSWYTSNSNAVVLCAVPGCDHRSCGSGPFHVVCVGVDDSDFPMVHAHVYSSESHSWRTTASSLDHTVCYFDMKRASLIGDVIYCTVNGGEIILKYDLVEHRFSFIDVPPYMFNNNPVLMQNEDGSLGIACVLGSRLHIWSAMVNAEGVTGWVKQRVINLKKILPVDVTSGQAKVKVFAEGVAVFFISTDVGAFTYELKSGMFRKVGIPRHYFSVVPFISFFTPDRGCSKWTK